MSENHSSTSRHGLPRNSNEKVGSSTFVSLLTAILPGSGLGGVSGAFFGSCATAQTPRRPPRNKTPPRTRMRRYGRYAVAAITHLPQGPIPRFRELGIRRIVYLKGMSIPIHLTPATG